MTCHADGPVSCATCAANITAVKKVISLASLLLGEVPLQHHRQGIYDATRGPNKAVLLVIMTVVDSLAHGA